MSIEGEQSGPFSLADAQRWVGGKPFEAELHCWCEGFDDWLPVDKVSHFRGLRKKPVVVQSPPPPIPRVQQRVASQPARARADVEEEPKPLFAATMASIESGVPRAEPRPKATPACRRAVGRAVGRRKHNGNALPSAGVGARNGKTGPTDAVTGNASGPQQGRPTGSGTGTTSALGGRAAPARDRTGPENAIAAKPAVRSSTRPGVGRAVPGFDAGSAVAAAAAAAAVVDEDSAKTRIEAPPFVEPPAAAKPVLASAPSSAFAPAPVLMATPVAMPAPVAMPDDAVPRNDDDMEIGEVSRVVNLADIARTPRTKDRAQPARRPSFNRSPSIAEGTSQAALADPYQVAGVDGGVAPAGAGVGYAPGFDAQAYPGAVPGATDLVAAEVPLAPTPSVNHRSSFAALLIVALLLVGSAAGVVVYIVLKGDDTPLQLADHNADIDSTRPDDPNYRPPVNPDNPTQPTPHDPQPQHVQYPHLPHNPVGPGPNVPDKNPTNPLGPDSPLKPEEVEDKYTQSNSLTQRCWERAQKKDPFIVKDVKRVVVTLTVAADGGVGNVSFARAAAGRRLANLGRCLGGIIKKWNFRSTRDGLTAKITMAFQ